MIRVIWLTTGDWRLAPCRKSARVGDCNAEILVRIDGRVVDAHFVVEVRTGATSAETDVADDVAAAYMLSGTDRKGRQVAEARDNPVTMIEHHRAAIAAHIVGEVHLAVGRSYHRLTDDRSNIDSSVERAFTVERIDTFAK